MVPRRLQRWWQGTSSAVLLTLDANNVMLEELVGGQRQRLFSIQLQGDETAKRLQVAHEFSRIGIENIRPLLLLPVPKALRRTITLPLAVEENLGQSLRFELDRFSPFKPDQAYFDFRLLERDLARGSIRVELVVIERAVADLLTTKAAALGIPLDGAVLPGEDSETDSFYNLLPNLIDNNRRSPATRRRTALLLVSVLLLITLLAIPVWQKRAAAISLLTPLGQAKAGAEAADVLRNRLDRLLREHSFLLDMKWEAASTVLVLEELSRLLPDDTFITQLDFDGKAINVQGESASASRLVELLESSPLFKDVGFKAQLTKIQGTTNDRFHIMASFEDARARPPVTNSAQAAVPSNVSKDSPAPPPAAGHTTTTGNP